MRVELGLIVARLARVFPWTAWSKQLRQGWSQPHVRWLAAIMVLAAALRIVWVLYAARLPLGLNDPVFYLGYGNEISNGGGYQTLDGVATAYRPIGYPAALAGVFALVKYTPLPDNLGNLVLAGAFFNVVLGTATVGLVYHVGRRLFSSAVGLLAALWLALFPSIIFHTALLLTETLFNFLVMAAILVLVGASWRHTRLSWVRLAIFAVLVGLATLVRPISLLFLPILPIVWLASGFGWRRSFAYAGLVFVVVAAVLTPWAIRNFIVMDAPIIISTNLGDNLCIGNHPGAPGHFNLAASCFPPSQYLVGTQREVQRNSDNIRNAVTFALTNPGAELKLLSRKAWFLWEDDHDALASAESYGVDEFIDRDLRTALERTADIFYFITISVGGLGLVGLILPPRDGRRLFFLLALLAFAGAPLVWFGHTRFHVPVMPFLVVAAAWAVISLRHVPGFLARLERREGAN